MWIDVHTHINMLEMQPEQALQQAREAGVERMITIGTGHDDFEKVMHFVNTYQPTVYGTLGFHPHDAKTLDEKGEAFLRANLNHPRIVAVGEIGLDYYYEHSPREVQHDMFRRQLTIAQEFKMPVEIHTRDAEEDTFKILNEYKGSVRGILHCFTSSMDLAKKALDLGYNISFSGVLTFKNADALRDVARYVPLDRMHVETDAPFLTPVPLRGKKNEPAFVKIVAEKMAELKGVTLEQLAEQLKKNALDMFPKLNW